MKLTATGARKAGAGRHHDGQGLYLLVKESGARSWVLRVQQDGTRHEIGLGSFGQNNAALDIPIMQRRILSLAEAREKASMLRRYAKAGGNPYAERDRDRILHRTFESVVQACHAEYSKGWSPKTAKGYLASLETHAYPVLRQTYIEHIDASHFLKVLRPIWLDRPQMADKVAKNLKSTLQFARSEGWRKVELPDWKMIQKGLPPRDKTEKHFAAVPWEELPQLICKLEPDSTGRAALLFAILTAARSGEVRKARWDQFDLDAGLWNRPAEIMKAKKAHRVTLSRQVVKLLRDRPVEGDFVFSSPRGGMISDMTITKALRSLGRDETVHGFRSSFRQWAAVKMPTLREAAEIALAHSIKDKTEAAYQRSDLIDLRGPLLQAWSDYCFDAEAGNVIAIGSAA